MGDEGMGDGGRAREVADCTCGNVVSVWGGEGFIAPRPPFFFYRCDAG